jgi:hypothetical protein
MGRIALGWKGGQYDEGDNGDRQDSMKMGRIT